MSDFLFSFVGGFSPLHFIPGERRLVMFSVGPVDVNTGNEFLVGRFLRPAVLHHRISHLEKACQRPGSGLRVILGLSEGSTCKPWYRL